MFYNLTKSTDSPIWAVEMTASKVFEEYVKGIVKHVKEPKLFGKLLELNIENFCFKK